jgi:hypothetical protein
VRHFQDRLIAGIVGAGCEQPTLDQWADRGLDLTLLAGAQGQLAQRDATAHIFNRLVDLY